MRKKSKGYSNPPMLGDFKDEKARLDKAWAKIARSKINSNTGKKYGVAVDLGTTTLVMHLVDLATGAKLGAVGRLNPQAVYGADVTARIMYCVNNGHETLTELIQAELSDMAHQLIAAHGGGGDGGESADSGERTDSGASVGRSEGARDSKTDSGATQIEQAVIAGNTIMQHLAAGYSPISMGTSPFTTVSLFGKELPAWKTFPLSQNGKIYYTPAISAYVGGDITAGLLAAGFEEINDTALFIDIGTNGEIALKHKGTYYCCAAAAGPAFEGAEITMGMAAISGAIDHVWQNSDVEFSVIGNTAPKGLCGSGLLDLLALLLDTGAVDSTGRLIGTDKYYLTGATASIYITGEDIRSLQLAKAAIAGGIQVLLHYAGITEKDIKLLALAGGFGSFINTKSAARVGLFPKTLLPAAKAYGNTSGEGAVQALTGENVRKKLENIRRRCEYIELSSNALFNDKFLEEIGFAV